MSLIFVVIVKVKKKSDKHLGESGLILQQMESAWNKSDKAGNIPVKPCEAK